MFPKRGQPYLERVDLPETTEAIEAHVVRLFAQRLADGGHDVEVLPRPPGDWPDGAIVVDGRRVGLELVEVVDGQHRQKVQGQGWYLSEFRHAFARRRLGKALAGMELELFDMYKGLPPARARAARQLVDLIATELSTKHEKAFVDTPVGGCQIAQFDFPPREIKLVAQRVTNDISDFRIRWNGAYFVDHMCLKGAVQKKVGQLYAGRDGHDMLWLVAWDSFGYLVNSAKQAARTPLDASPHPFDAVWTCSLAGPRVTFLEQLWPYEPADVVEDDLREMISMHASSWL